MKSIVEEDAYCEDCGKETLWLWKQPNFCSTFGSVDEGKPRCPACGSSRVKRKETAEEKSPTLQEMLEEMLKARK